MMKLLCGSILVLVLFFDVVQGGTRIFTDDQGRQIEAEMVGVRGENIVLRRNGRMAQWPVKKLSEVDQRYVSEWKNSASRNTPKIQARIWERDGIGEKGLLNQDRLEPTLGKNIPLLKQTDEKGYFKHYDIDLHNRSAVDADNLMVSYVLYVITPQNKVIDETGREAVSKIGSNSRTTISTEGITYVRSKTKSTTFSTNILGNLQVGSDTKRSKEKFGGAWVRVYSPNGEIVGETKQLSPQLEALDPQWTGDSGHNAIPVPASLSQLEELLGPIKEIIKNLPERPPGLPKLPRRPGFPPIR